MHINLVWDKWLDTPLPNGLHPKYYPEWHTKWKNNYSTNVLTRFVPLDRYNLGFFPLLLSSASITYSDIEVDKAVDNQLPTTTTVPQRAHTMYKKYVFPSRKGRT